MGCIAVKDFEETESFVFPMPQLYEEPKDEVIGICSGYFRLLHLGHIKYLESAAAACDKLFVIVNNDKQLALKGRVSPFNENQRLLMIQALKPVHTAILSKDTDSSVSETLRWLHKIFADDKTRLVFFNDGDIASLDDLRETKVCQELGIEIKFLWNEKVDSSTDVERRIKYG